MNVTAARPVTEPSQVAEGRRLVLWLASRLDFSEERAGQAALIASELGTNLAKHARGGELLVRPLTTSDGEPGGLEILSLDKGPGMPELSAARRDGYSTTGTLGHGLGAIERQADQLDIYTHTSGTAIAARIWRERPPVDTGQSRFDVGAVHVSKTGEMVCGDDWGWRQRNGRLCMFIADGLGHGEDAAVASNRAGDVLDQNPGLSLENLLGEMHRALRKTRGAAVSIATLDAGQRTHMHGPATIETAAVQNRPMILDGRRVFTDQIIRQLGDTGRHGFGAPFHHRLAPAGDALVGVDLQKQPARRHHKGGELGDLHETRPFTASPKRLFHAFCQTVTGFLAARKLSQGQGARLK